MQAPPEPPAPPSVAVDGPFDWTSLEALLLVLLGALLGLLVRWIFTRLEHRNSEDRDLRAIRAPLYDEAQNLVGDMQTHMTSFGIALAGNGAPGQDEEEFAERDNSAAEALQKMMDARLAADKVVSRMRTHASYDAAASYLRILEALDRFTTEGLIPSSDGEGGRFVADVFNREMGAMKVEVARFQAIVRRELWNKTRSAREPITLSRPTRPFDAGS